MQLLDVTGEHPLVPTCPRCKEKPALIADVRYAATKEQTGFYRCPMCHHVYIPETL